jgi:hypothetical protein
VLDCGNKRHIRGPFGRLALLLARRSPLKSVFSALVAFQNASYTLCVMQTFQTDIVVEKDGKLHLEHLPFSEGEAVHVFVSSATPVSQQPLKGSVLKYERPLEPVAEEDWEAAK